MRESILLVILTVGLFSCNEGGESKIDASSIDALTTIKNVEIDKDIYTKYEYIDPDGKSVLIQNGYPKGGVKYTDANNNVGGYAVFWTRIVNETDNPLELEIDLPIKSHEISNFPGKYYKVLIPADTMTIDKLPMFFYGLTDIESFLENNINKPTLFKRTINPKESSGLYFLMLVLTEEATGMTRTSLSLKGQDLFYKVARYSITKPISLIDEKEFKCGSINLKNLRLQK